MEMNMQLSLRTAEKKFNYLKRQTRNALSGIMFSRTMLEGTNAGEMQNQLLHCIDRCERQLNRILNDGDFQQIINGSLSFSCDLDPTNDEFTLQDVLDTSIRQVFTKSDGKEIQILNETSEEILGEKLLGESLRLQQVYTDFLVTCIKFTPQRGQILISASLTKGQQITESLHVCRLELRITNHGGRVPVELVEQMLKIDGSESDEGFSLFISRQLLILMNGKAAYLLEEAEKESFILTAEVAWKPQNFVQ